MPEKTYGELLKDSRWQRKRLEILSRDKWSCQACYAVEQDEISLHVHHKQYKRGAKPWEYDNDFLITLCESCHELATADGKAIQDALRVLQPGLLSQVHGFIEMLAAVTDYEGHSHERFVPKNMSHAQGAARALGIPEFAIIRSAYEAGGPYDRPGKPVDLRKLFEKRHEFWREDEEFMRVQIGQSDNIGTDGGNL